MSRVSNTWLSDMGFEIRRDYWGKVILVWTYPGGEKEISNLQKAPDAVYNYVKRYVMEGYTRPSRLPQWLKWAPGVINLLDDSQDMLITGLYLARPLLRKLPGKLLPGVGWAMVASDLLDFTNSVLGAATTPAFRLCGKQKQYKDLEHSLKDPAGALKNFLGRRGWRDKLGFALQGLQVTQQLFGKGLMLGPIMGSLSDSVWDMAGYVYSFVDPEGFGSLEQRALVMDAAWRQLSTDSQRLLNAFLAAGAKLWNDATSLWPFNRSGIYDASARVLLQMPQLHNFVEILDDEDLIMVLAAQKMATGIMAEANFYPKDKRTDGINMLPFPMARPVKPASVQALKDAGANVDDFKCALDTSDHWPTIGHAIDESLANHDYLESVLRGRASKNIDLWSDVYDMYNESGQETLESLTQVPASNYTEWDKRTIAAFRVGELNVAAPRGFTTAEGIKWIDRSIELAVAKGYKMPNVDEWRQASVEIFGSSKYKYPP